MSKNKNPQNSKRDRAKGRLVAKIGTNREFAIETITRHARSATAVPSGKTYKRNSKYGGWE